MQGRSLLLFWGDKHTHKMLKIIAIIRCSKRDYENRKEHCRPTLQQKAPGETGPLKNMKKIWIACHLVGRAQADTGGQPRHTPGPDRAEAIRSLAT